MTNKKSYPVLFKMAIIALMCILLGATWATGAGQAVPSATSGVLDLSNYDLYQDGNIRLDGQWQFFWKMVPSPESFLKDNALEPTGYYPVPRYWTAYEGLSLPPEGSASYRLRIHVDKINRPLSLMIPEIFTEYQLFVNGNILDSHGKFADGRIRFLSPRIFTFHNSNDTIEILLNIENHSHGNAGIGQSFFLGAPEKILKQHLFSTIIEMILVAVCLFAGIYHIILFSLRSKEKELLYFSLFCILISFRTLFTGTTFIMQIIPGMSFESGSRSATAVIPLCLIAFQTYAFHFFGPHFPVKPHRALLMVHAGYLILTLTLPTMIYTKLFTPYLLVILASCFFIMGVNACSMVKRLRYSSIFLAGFMFVFAGVVNDILHYKQIINTGYFLSLWFSLFIIAQSVMLAIKFANEHKMVETLSKRLKASDKLKDEFLANTSHELRTPLVGIIGISDSLADGVAGNLSKKAVLNLKLISSSAKRLASLINDILDYSKLRNSDIPLVVKNIDLRQIVEVVLTVVKATAPSKKLELINEVSNQFPAVSGDENRLQQILFNLMGNAVKFTEEGQVKVSAQDKGSHVIIHVKDTGCGIPEDKLEAIFQSFEQVDGTTTRNYGGTGLGLPITRKLVELHGGRISVQSFEQKGSIFSFTLEKGSDDDKLYSEKIITPDKMDISKESIPNNILPVLEPTGDEITGEKILIVDDETTNIRVLQNYLSLGNYRFEYATNGVNAIKMIETREFDLILLDIMMPRMSGYEVLERIRKQYTAYELPVLMLTAGKQNRDIVTAFQSGANDYLTKPVDRQELMARIRTQLSLSRAVADAIKNANLANTDELTGLYNRRFMISYGNREFTNTILHDRPLSVIMLDIDRFKGINDHYGHAEGDRVLQHLAGIIISNIRGIDVAARYGGEEFVVILPSTIGEGARQAAEKIRHLIEQSRVPTADNKIIKYTASFGVTSFHDPECCFEDLLKEADKMLYQSKNEGRNKVLVHP